MERSERPVQTIEGGFPHHEPLGLDENRSPQRRGQARCDTPLPFDRAEVARATAVGHTEGSRGSVIEVNAVS